MIDATALTLALRNRAIGTVAATTGSISISATATGYARATGSFLDDGFAKGMEVKGAGFSAAANNAYGVIEAVTALAMTIGGGRTVEASATRSVSAGLPETRFWENLSANRISGRPYIEEALVPSPGRLLTTSPVGGTVEESGSYILRFYGLSGEGLSGLRKLVSAVQARFTPGTQIALTGAMLKINSEFTPYQGQVLRIEGGWSAIVLTIPYRAWSTNLVTA